jgi:hypothetical protein
MAHGSLELPDLSVSRTGASAGFAGNQAKCPICPLFATNDQS